jgi:autotransporter-associated beta strand protein
MKPKASLRHLLAACATMAMTANSAHAQTYYYWDTNGTTAGLGDTAGTWGTSAFSGLINAPNGRGLVGGTLATANVATTSGHWMNFGTINLSLGRTASTIGIAGPGVTINRIMFGFGQTNAVTLSGGGGSITLAGTAPSIYANSAAGATIGAVLAGSAGMTMAGPSTLNLTGANIYTGTTNIVGGGTLNVGNGVTGNLNNTTPSALTFNLGGGVFNVAQATGSAQSMGALTFTGGDGTVRSTAASGVATQTLTFASLAARAAGATGNLVLATNTTAADNKIVLTGAPTGFLDKGIFFGGSSYAANDASGFVRGLIYGTDADTAATDTITASNHVQLTSSPAARAGDTLLSLNLSGSGVNYTMDSGSLTVPAILKSGGGAESTISGGAGLTTASNAELVIRSDTSSDLLTISSAVTGFSGGLTKTGAGTLTLSGENTYTGSTRINGGILALSGGTAIADTGAVILANAPGTTLKLNANETIGNLTGGGFSGGVVDVQGNTLTFGDSGNQTFGGTFTGTAIGAITKQGSGILSLSNVNTFAGSINLNAGTLDFNLGNSGTTSAQSISSGGAINMADGTTIRMMPRNLTDLGQQNGNNEPQLTAPNAWTIGNAINITSGTATFRFAQNGNRWNFTGGVTGATSGSQTLRIIQGSSMPGAINTGGGDSQAILFSGVIQDGVGGTLGVSADFTNSSSVNQTAFISLSGQNTFTGPITVSNTRGLNNGAFFVIGGDRINNTTGITPGSGYLGGGNYTNTISLATGTILNYASSANQILGGAISGTGAILKEGAGTLTLSGDNTMSFVLPGAGAPALTTGVAIRAGTLSVGSLNSVVGGTTTSNLGAPTTVAAGTIAIGAAGVAGTLSYTGTGEITDRVINLAGTTGGAVIDQSGASGVLRFTSALTATGAGLKTLTLQGSNDGTGEIAGAIVNNSGTNRTSVSKQGTGTWVLSGTNTYTGTTTVGGGKLLINGNSSTANGNVSVTAGTLGGTGITGGAVSVAGAATLAPGASIESFTTGAVTMADTSIFVYEVADNTSTGADLLAVGGALSLTNVTLSLDPATLAALGGGGWALGNKLTLISYVDAGAGLTAGFASYNDNTAYSFGANQWFFDYNDTTSGGNFAADATAASQNYFVTMTVIPEPSTALLGGLGLFALLRRRRG